MVHYLSSTYQPKKRAQRQEPHILYMCGVGAGVFFATLAIVVTSLWGGDIYAVPLNLIGGLGLMVYCWRKNRHRA